MDELSSAMAAGVHVTGNGLASTCAPPSSCFSHLYKQGSASVVILQQQRREDMLQAQKQRRFDFISHARRLTEADWEDGDEEYKEKSDEESMEMEQFTKPGRHYKNQLMLSEWMLQVPADFELQWLMMICPVGRRNLIVASRGITSAYAKNGYCMKRFHSLLPGGSHRVAHRKAVESTILDCIYCELTQTFYVLDMMCWRGQPIYDSETEFRFYWLQTKLAELDDVDQITERNQFRFEVLPSFSCNKSVLEEALSKEMNVELDGLLFYHRAAHYTFGASPLVLWLKPHMLPEVLNVTVPVCSKTPTSYKGFSEHARQVRLRSKGHQDHQTCEAVDESTTIIEGSKEAADEEEVMMGCEVMTSLNGRRRGRRKKKKKVEAMEY